jgi:hypothetical protein
MRTLRSEIIKRGLINGSPQAGLMNEARHLLADGIIDIEEKFRTSRRDAAGRRVGATHH